MSYLQIRKERGIWDHTWSHQPEQRQRPPPAPPRRPILLDIANAAWMAAHPTSPKQCRRPRRAERRRLSYGKSGSSPTRAARYYQRMPTAASQNTDWPRESPCASWIWWCCSTWSTKLLMHWSTSSQAHDEIPFSRQATSQLTTYRSNKHDHDSYFRY
jgi:hypothetical protein